MSFSIQEGVDELREKLAAMTEIAEKYPDAELRTVCGRQLWVSDRVVPTEVDFLIAAGSASSSIMPDVMVLGYTTVSDSRRHTGVPRIYQTPEKAIALYPTYLRTEAPDVHAALVELCKKQG
jgi:hypothetical protein